MFDSFKTMAGMAKIMSDLPRIRQALEDVRRRLEQQRVTAERGDGAVRVTASGLMRIVAVDLEPGLLARFASGGVQGAAPDRAKVSRLILDATNEALDKAKQMAEQSLAAAAAEFDLPLPPGALTGFMAS